MSLATACALAPALNHQQRDPAAEVAALGQIAAWAVQFTPAVSLQPPRGLLLEVEGSLRLLGGIGRILDAVKRGVADMGFTLSVACAPTARTSRSATGRRGRAASGRERASPPRARSRRR